MKFLGRHKLSRQIFIYSVIISVLPLLLTAAASYNIFSRSSQAGIRDKLIAISDGKDALLDELLSSISAFIVERASGPTPVAAFEKLSTAFKVSGIESQDYKLLDSFYKKAFQKYLDVNDYIYDMLFISNEGDIIFSLKHERDFGANINDPLLKGTILTGLINSVKISLSPAFSDFDFYPLSDKPALFVATPVFGKDRLLGEMAFRIKPEALNNFAQNYIGLGKTGEILLAKGSGGEVIYTTPFRFKRDAALAHKIKIGSSAAMGMQRAVMGMTGIGLVQDYRGETVIARWQYVPQLRWGMIVKEDKYEAFGPIYQLRNVYIMISFLLIGLLLWAAFVISRRIADPIETIHEGLRIIGGGNLDHKLEISRDDEIGELSRMFNLMAKDLKESRERLVWSERLAALGKLAGFVSHELRNPLGVMKNILYYFNMLELGKDNAEVKENLDMLSAEIEKSDRIIGDLLEFSRIKKPIFHPGNINMIINEILNRLTNYPNIEVVKEFERDMPDIDIDALHIHQVFYNLAKNGMEAMGGGGTLTIRTALEGDFIEVSFSDTGIGIPSENLGKIFEPLFSTKVKGTGLGLAICNMLVSGHGGSIEVKSEMGKGTTFTVRLPVKRTI